MATCVFCHGSGIRVPRKTRQEEACKACNGVGSIERSKRKNADGSFKAKENKKTYPHFTTFGPLPVHQDDPTMIALDDEDLCYLVGEWKIFQPIARHRYSTDDLVTAFVAKQVMDSIHGHEQPLRYLDIGCGIGSVLLSTSWLLPNATACLGVEVQESRYSLAKRSVEFNVGRFPSEQTRVQVLNCDLRDITKLKQWSQQVLHNNNNDNNNDINESDGSGGENDVAVRFDLITGTPPYFSPTTQHTQTSCHESLGCLFELKGNIVDYCATAAQFLRPPRSNNNNNNNNSSNNNSVEKPSLFVVCHSSLHATDTYLAALAAGLVVVERLDVIPRQGKPPLFSVFTTTTIDHACHNNNNNNGDNNNNNNGDSNNNNNASSFVQQLYPQLQCGLLRTMTKEQLQTRLLQLQQQQGLSLGQGRVEGSVYGERCELLCVRENNNNNNNNSHTREYAALLKRLGKPSSFDRETYNNNNNNNNNDNNENVLL